MVKKARHVTQWTRELFPSTAGRRQQPRHVYSRFVCKLPVSFGSSNKLAVMALVTYILLSTLLAGLRGAFHPELLGLTATTAFAVVIFEILGLKLGCYLLSISNESQLLDLVAYSGYKFVGIIVTIVIAEIGNRGEGTGGWIGWTVFIYTFLALAFFLVSKIGSPEMAHAANVIPQLRSLRYVLLPDNSSDSQRGGMQTVGRSQRNRRTQFLFIYSYVVQLVFMWVLSRQEVTPTKK